MERSKVAPMERVKEAAAAMERIKEAAAPWPVKKPEAA